jgi:predicted N-acetyltransferase YhbS
MDRRRFGAALIRAQIEAVQAAQAGAVMLGNPRSVYWPAGLQSGSRSR